jgi:hypothetical protein
MKLKEVNVCLDNPLRARFQQFRIERPNVLTPEYSSVLRPKFPQLGNVSSYPLIPRIDGQNMARSYRRAWRASGPRVLLL